MKVFFSYCVLLIVFFTILISKIKGSDQYHRHLAKKDTGFVDMSGKKSQTPGNAISSFAPGGQYVLLTFSGGPHAIHTLKLLNILKEKDALATFFVYGRSALYHPSLIKRMVEDGHDIGQQGFHPALSISPNVATDFFPAPPHIPSTFSLKKISAGIVATDHVLQNITQRAVRFYRPPITLSTHYSEVAEQLQRNHSSLQMVLSSLDSHDRLFDVSGAHKLVEDVLQRVKPGDIILCHDSQAVLLNALPLLLDKLIIAGYELLTLSQILTFPDDSPK